MYTTILTVFFGIYLFIVFAMVFIGYKFSDNQKRSAVLIAALSPISLFLYFFKTVLQIPTMIIIFSTFIPAFQVDMNVSDISPGISVTLGFSILLLFIIVQLYSISSFKEKNPFS